MLSKKKGNQKFIKASFNFPKLTDPRPVTGLNPFCAVKPYLQHTGFLTAAQQLFFPGPISWNTSGFVIAMKYSAGFAKPMGGFPAFSRASLIKVNIAAKTGVDADVPS